MEDPLSVDTTSDFSSIMDAPHYLERQYSPLAEMFQGHNIELPLAGSPENNSEAMISALKALQDKIRNLELKRADAARKFSDLAEEAERHTRTTQTPMVTISSQLSPPPYTTPSRNEDLKGRFESLDAKLTQQVKELDHMRECLQHAEADRHEVLTKHMQLGQQDEVLMEEQRKLAHHTPHQPSPLHPLMYTATEEKVRKLETGHAQLSARHTVTELKMEDLERCLQEQLQKQQFRDIDTKVVEGNTVLVKRTSQHRKIPAKRKKKVPRMVHPCTCGVRTVGEMCRCKPVPGVHYRMNLKDVPFVVGTSTTPSHSVGANYQNVLALMKAHSPLLCGAVAASRGHSPPTGKRNHPSASRAELKTLLAGLEEEFGRLTFKHQEIAKEIQKLTEPSNPLATGTLAKELEHTLDEMEAKTDQIKIVQKQLHSLRRQQHGKSCTQQTATLPLNGEVQASTTQKTMGSQNQSTCKTSGIEFLRKMKCLQNTLQRDDLSWD